MSVDVEVGNPKAQRKCVERNYTINLPAKTALRVSVDDFNPNVGMNFLEIKGTRGTLRFEEINVWKMFRNIERNPDRIGESFRSYEIIFNGS